MATVDDVTSSAGFRPGTEEGARAFIITPFTRMARAHAVGAVADAMVAASLAGSLFFAAPGGEARGPVFRYLIITMLPFSLLSPLIGPLIDRMHGGHRLMVIGSAALRGVAAWLMAASVNDGDFVFFLYALVLLVFQKGYAVARSALTPTLVVDDGELVRANSKLALLSGVASVVGVLPAGILIQLFGAQWSLRLAMIVYFSAAVMALRISPVRVADDEADEAERIELRGATIFMAGSAMGLIRGSVGFMMFLIAFSLSDGGKPTFAMAVVGAAMAAFQQIGNLVAPRLRSMTEEENLLSGVLALMLACGLASLVLGEVTGGVLIGASVGFAAGVGKLAFDSILQRDAPDANRGRAFARFETRFQITWVIGAALPVGLTLSATTGYLLLFGTALFAFSGYSLARLSYAHRTGAHQTIATARAAALDERIGEVSHEVKARLAAMPKAAYRKLRHSGSGVDHSDEDLAPDEALEQAGEAWDEDWVDDRDTAEHPAVGGPLDPGPDLGSDPTVVWDPLEAPDGPGGDGRGPDARGGRGYLEDLDPEVSNPFPWSPEDPTRPG